jgi:tetratricopeptide (TPR) repeat protein
VHDQGIFLSYAVADQRWAAWIREELQRAGHSVFAEESGLGPGSSWKLELEAQLAGARPALAVLSPDYLAMLRGRSIRERLPTSDLCAIRVRECEQSRTLEGVEVEDLVGLDEEAARTALLRAAARIASEPPGPPTRRVKGAFPGGVPTIWHVPVPRNPEFLGRTEILAEMSEALKHGRMVALTGVTGVGKTQVASEYAYRNAGDYSLVWWIRAETEELLSTDVTELARRLRPRGGDEHRAIRRWLSLHDRWLLVIDEAADPNALPPILPRRRRGDVIITSLNPSWDDDRTDVIPVPAMRRAEAVDYLLGNTDEEHSEEAAALADLVGNLPGALQVVAEAAREPDVSLGDLTVALERDATEGDTVRARLTLAIQNQLRVLERDSPGALELLQVMAFFAPGDIPLALLEDWEPSEGAEGVTRAPESVGSLVEALGHYGFVSVASDGVFVNQLVRVAARDAMPAEQARRRAETALGIVCEALAFQVEYNENWSVTARMLPHALRVARHAERRGVDPGTVSWLLNQIGLYHLQRANYAEAAETLRRALELAEQAFDPSDPSIGVIANNLGSALQNLGELEEAEALARRSVSILGAEGDPSAELGIALANLGSVLRDAKDFNGARDTLERAIEVETAARGPDDPVVALRLNDLGRVLRERGDLQSAREYLERARNLVVDRTDLEAPRIAPILWNLGEVRRELKDFDGSRQVLEMTLPMVEGWYGPSHPEVAKHSRSLGLTLYEAGHYEEALTLLRRALAIDESAFGSDHPAVAADSHALKTVLAKQATGAVETLVRGFE